MWRTRTRYKLASKISTTPKVFDGFCGAGGSSTGLAEAGFEVRAAANHWQLAITSHSANHPGADHYCEDLQEIHPSRFPWTEVLWMSPECTNHSLAKGRKRSNMGQRGFWDDPYLTEDEIRSRATMREVYDHLEYHQNYVAIVENVVDVRRWEHYTDWLTAIENLGYMHKTLYLNSMFFGVPQSRDRWYTVFWRNDMRAPDLDFRPMADCEKHGRIRSVQSWKKAAKQWGKYGKRNQYLYRCPRCNSEVVPDFIPCRTAIDWSVPVQRIGDRAEPLEQNTLDRIEAGLRKFGWIPFTSDMSHPGGGHESRVRSVQQTLSTLTGTLNHALVQPDAAFITSQYSRLSANSGIDAPYPSITGFNNQHALIYVYHSNPTWRNMWEAMPTITGAQTHALIDPMPAVEDCGFRMLTVPELKAGMAMPIDYIVVGSKENQVKQIGNAVVPTMAQIIGERVMEIL